MMKKTILFLLLLALPSVWALNCTEFEYNKGECNFVFESGLSEEEKDYLGIALKRERGLRQEFDIEEPEILEVPNFVVKTDKTVYEAGDEIKVEVLGTGNYQISYAEQQAQGKEAVLTAVYPDNEIMVVEGKMTAYKHVHIKDKEPWTVLFSFGVFGSVNYVLMGFIRKYWGVFL